MDTVSIPVQRTSEAASLPRVMQAGDVAADVMAAEATVIPARGRALVATGLILELPEGFRARVHSRSGLSLKHGIEAGAGLIDQGYRHTVGILLYNHSDVDFPVAVGDRVAQLCIERYTHPVFVDAEQVEKTSRTTGWGSSGVS
jgi:dUTP pyrophosphatase